MDSIRPEPKPRKIMLVFGTRPEAVKMAPVYAALKAYPGCFEVRVLVTAQHREMLDQVLRLFAIVPDFDLNVMTEGQSLADLAARILPGTDRLLREECPDLVLVHGDTSTTFLASLAAFYNHIPVGHVEAGLRTRDKYAPFPEELNRHLTGVIADWHFAPTDTARRNLLREGVASDFIFVTGNTVIDALLHTLETTGDLLPAFMRDLPPTHRLLLVTTHRRENLGNPLRGVYQALRRVVEENADVEVIFPVHLNPAVRSVVREELGGIDRIHLCDPLDYAPFVQVMNCSYLVLTDSGGLQEEAPALGKPVLVLREVTERPEAVGAGTVALVGTAQEIVYRETTRLLHEQDAYERMSRAVNPYGDGRAAARIAAFLRRRMGFCSEEPEEFTSVDGSKVKKSKI